MSPWTRAAILLLFGSLCAAGLLRHPGFSPAGRVEPSRLFAAIEGRIAGARSAGAGAGAPFLPASGDARALGEPPASAPSARESREARSAARVEFGRSSAEKHAAAVQVFFVGGDGRVTPAIYRLREEGGFWEVESVRFEERWETGERLGGIEL